MAKQKKKQDSKQKQQKPELEFQLPIKSIVGDILPFGLMIVSIILCWYYISYTLKINGFFSFPIDDPWIHLTFARNLADFGSFSYFRNEIVTAGSTSPLYTMILAAGFFITKNEMILSYVVCIAFLLLAILFFYKLSSDSFPKENWMAIAGTLLFVVDKWMNLIAVSGMETTMFIFILIACFYYYRKRNPIGVGVTIGLILWARPDGAAFIGALVVDYLLLLYFKQKSPAANTEFEPFTKKDLLKIASIFGVLTVLYFFMNYMLSGSLMPNTFNAKLTYYSPEFRSRADFLKGEVWDYFTADSYAIMIVPFFIGAAIVIFELFKSKYNKFFLPVLFIFALIFIYWYKMPYAHRFGRYLMPVIPFYILVFMYGTRTAFKFLYKLFNDKGFTNAFNIILVLAAIIYAAYAYYDTRTLYQDNCSHIYFRQVSAAKWLHNNTPEGSVVATHDVGAIGYYSGRKVIDVAGLINPELITKLNDKNYNIEMTEAMKKSNVTYTAFLKEWYQVVNQNPLFVGVDNDKVETMEIFKFEPGKTHVLSAEVNSMIQYALSFINSRQVPQAMQVLNKVISLDPESSYSYFILANAQYLVNDMAGAEKSIKKALEIFPEYRMANLMLADVYKKEMKMDESKTQLQNYLKINPADSTAISKLSLFKDSTKVNLK